MRVAVVTTSWPKVVGDPSGHFVQTEARALEAEGHDVVVVAAEGDAFGWPGALPRLRQNPLRLFGAARWIRSARHTVQVGEFDRVIAHWAVPCAFPIAFDAPGELEIVSHGSDVGLLERMPRRVVEMLAERATEWRFVSAGLLERFARLVPSRLLSKATVRPCAIEIPDVADLALRKQREIGRPFVSAIGRLVSSKRVDRIISVARAERVPLVVVGDGPERRRLERLGDARFVGTVPRHEGLAWMKASSALWFASRQEGFPTVLREAEALGVPVRML